MRALLYSLDSEVAKLSGGQVYHKHFRLINDLRNNILSAPHKKWSVRIMADSINMSPSYFQHLYKELFGIPCMQDVIAARLENAKFYLNTTNMSIQSLADFCGYDNALHFMRQFKKQEGLTPTQYRLSSRINNKPR